jgi:hypothetical protein
LHKNWDWEHLLSKCKVLSSNPSTSITEKRTGRHRPQEHDPGEPQLVHKCVCVCVCVCVCICVHVTLHMFAYVCELCIGMCMHVCVPMCV